MNMDKVTNQHASLLMHHLFYSSKHSVDPDEKNQVCMRVLTVMLSDFNKQVALMISRFFNTLACLQEPITG